MSGIEHSTDSEPVEQVRVKLEDLKTIYGFREPDRGNLNDPNIKWRKGKPDYTKANYEYLKGKTQNHPEGSLEEIVENLVKKWEFEATHFKDYDQWTTVDFEHYEVAVNDNETLPGKYFFEMGNYNTLLSKCPGYQKYGKLDFEESHNLFRNAFRKGFPWEVLKVFTKPPHVLFTWRHWGEFIGEFQGNKGNGETIELFGLLRCTLNEQLEIKKVEVYFDPDTFLEVMEGKKQPHQLQNGISILGDVHQTAIEKMCCRMKHSKL